MKLQQYYAQHLAHEKMLFFHCFRPLLVFLLDNRCAPLCSADELLWSTQPATCRRGVTCGLATTHIWLQQNPQQRERERERLRGTGKLTFVQPRTFQPRHLELEWPKNGAKHSSVCVCGGERIRYATHKFLNNSISELKHTHKVISYAGWWLTSSSRITLASPESWLSVDSPPLLLWLSDVRRNGGAADEFLVPRAPPVPSSWYLLMRESNVCTNLVHAVDQFVTGNARCCYLLTLCFSKTYLSRRKIYNNTRRA